MFAKSDSKSKKKKTVDSWPSSKDAADKALKEIFSKNRPSGNN